MVVLVFVTPLLMFPTVSPVCMSNVEEVRFKATHSHSDVISAIYIQFLLFC